MKIASILLALCALSLPAQTMPIMLDAQAGAPAACSLSYTTNLAAWYQADNASNTCTSGCTNGNPITTVHDNSGNGNHLINGTPGTYASSQINGLPAINFVASSSQYYDLTNAINCAGNCTIFATYKLAANSGTGYTLLSGPNGSITYWLDKGTPSEQGADFTNLSQMISGTASPDTSWHQGNLNFVNIASVTLRLGESADGTTATGDALSGSETVVGVNNGVQYMNGYMQEMLIYTASLSPTNTSTVETYLHCRTGL